jgi:hypothetical protein
MHAAGSVVQWRRLPRKSATAGQRTAAASDEDTDGGGEGDACD